VSDVDSHSEVLEALRTGDAEHAERTVFEHHSRSEKRLVERLEEMET
jgi:DNA-binding GntR family transcriptional regulator